MTDIFGDTTRAELRQEITRLRAELAALKKADPLAEMWRELEAYQEQADRDGHGESWRTMCRERTEDAAWAAADAARAMSRAAVWAASRDVAAAASDAAEYAAAARAADAAFRAKYAREAIDSIRRAKEAKR